MTTSDRIGPDVGTTLTELYPTLLRFAAVVGSVDVEPCDLVQEAVLATLRAHPTLDVRDPAAYLRQAILNGAKNRSRSLARRRLALGRMVAEEAAAASFPSDLDDLMRLPPETRAVLYLTVVEQHTHAEAAAIVGCSERAARARSSRGLRRLRAQLIEEVGQ
jgi:DNA-directed RNA polymerase specialized sigma24 family protein